MPTQQDIHVMLNDNQIITKYANNYYYYNYCYNNYNNGYEVFDMDVVPMDWHEAGGLGDSAPV